MGLHRVEGIIKMLQRRDVVYRKNRKGEREPFYLIIVKIIDCGQHALVMYTYNKKTHHCHEITNGDYDYWVNPRQYSVMDTIYLYPTGIRISEKDMKTLSKRHQQYLIRKMPRIHPLTSETKRTIEHDNKLFRACEIFSVNRFPVVD